MQILQVGKYFYPEKGGIETVTKSIYEELNDGQTKVDVLCFSRRRKTTRLKDGNSFILKCGSFFRIASTSISFGFLRQFKKLRNNYDIIHLHLPNPLGAIALYLYPPKGKVLVYWHSDIVKQKFLYSFFRFFEKKALERADLILGTSPVYVQHSAPLQPFLHKAGYLSCCTDDGCFSVHQAEVERIKDFFGNRKIIFSLGRFIYYKGFEYLIEAARFLPEDYVVVIGGGGPLKSKYLKLINSLNLSNKVFLISDIPFSDVGNYYSAAHTFCLPSTEKAEAFGVVIAEAMCFSKPVVATKIHGSGVAWVNLDGITGFNVSPRNSEQLAAAILRIDAEGLYESFAKNARHRFIEKFTISSMGDELRAYYNSLLHPQTGMVKDIRAKVMSS